MQKQKPTINNKLSMKKILLTIALAASSTLLFAQGSIVFYNIGAAAGNYYANSTVTNLTPTSTAAPSAYYYTLLVAAYGGAAPVDNPTNSAWSQAIVANAGTHLGALLLGNNSITAGSLSGQMANSYTVISGSTASADEYIMLVGWSANEGTLWSTVYSELTGTGLVQGGYFGYSPVGTVLLGPTGGPGANMYAAPGILTGITMNYVTIPEPATMALVGLGGLSLLLFRRRK